MQSENSEDESNASAANEVPSHTEGVEAEGTDEATRNLLKRKEQLENRKATLEKHRLRMQVCQAQEVFCPVIIESSVERNILKKFCEIIKKSTILLPEELEVVSRERTLPSSGLTQANSNFLPVIPSGVRNRNNQHLTLIC